MNIYIDESGTFVSAKDRGSWNVVAAFVVPESSRAKIESALAKLKQKIGHSSSSEIKLNQIDEATLAAFLHELSSSRALLFCTATDAGINTNEAVSIHKAGQVKSIRDNIPRMRYPGGRQGVELLANEIEGIPNQLYVQLVCQVNLLYEVLARSINYYAQRIPGTLGAFRWRIDQKSSSRTAFENAFEKIAPALLQTKSIREPMPFVRGFNYSKMKRYEFENGEIPGYLAEDHDIHIEDAFNIQKVVREDIDFIDSKKSTGVQVADILASATRRSLRGSFRANLDLSSLLGKLMVQRSNFRPPIELISFEEGGLADRQAEESVRAMHAQNQSMLLR